MAASSPRLLQYDVFLSFRGSDTRKGFLSFLFEALVRNQIDAFIDYNLERGEEIAPSLLDKISNSHLSLVVFSPYYAASEWCLEELAKIHHCMDQAGQLVLPVFYDVDPTEVRQLTGKYEEAMASHGDRFDPELVESWRRAIDEISSLSGFSSQDTESEAKLVDEIVNDILKKLELIPSSDFHSGFVGMEARIQELESLLSPNNVLSVGIWGMGGIGKTALAENLFNKISDDFDGLCFVNVKEELDECSLAVLKSKILSSVLGVPGLSIGTPSLLPMPVRRRLRMKRVLIVLDDVTTHQMLQALAGHRDLYCPGSKIIVTSRNKQVLKKWCDRTFEVQKLTYRHGFQLFRWHAFEDDLPREEILELSQRVVKFVDGVPLAFKVLGANLYGRSLEDWESTLVKLERIPDKEIMQILQISFDGLEQHEKWIFLDIACFFKNSEKDHVERVLDACDFYASHGITSLIEKCLVTVSNKKMRMHDLLRQMGQDMVRRESIHDPENRSRLWDHKEIYNVMSRNKGTEKIEGIALDVSKSREMALSSAAFSRMHNLRLLKFYNPCPLKVKLRLPSGLEFLPDELRLLSWCQYPLESLPSGFFPENLVELHMPDSRVKQLWENNQSLINLKIMDLSHSEELTKMPDFSQVPNLEKLDLTGCISLDEVPSSIGNLRNLASLNLSHCKKLETVPFSFQNLSKLGYLKVKGCKGIDKFPSCVHMENLYYLSLENCSKITEFPEIPLGIKILDLGGTSIEELPPSIGQYSQLITLDLTSCQKIGTLPSTIGNLKLLQQLHLSGCFKLSTLPKCVFDMKFLRALTLTCLDPEGLPEEMADLEALERLIIHRSPITKLPSSFSRLTRLGYLFFLECQGLILPDCSGLKSLRTLQLVDCGLTEIPQTLGTFLPLEELHIRDFNLVRIHPSIKQLSRLEVLYARDCKALEGLPELPPGLARLKVCNCTSLTYVPSLLTQDSENQGAAGIRVVNFGNCFNLNLHTRNKILDEAQQVVHHFATYFLNKEFDEKDSTEELEFVFIITEVRFCIPGSELPDWFHYQSAGCSVIVQASNSSEVLDFCRLAFGVVVACNGDYNSDDFDIRCECLLKTHSGQYIECDSYYYSPDPVDLEYWDPVFLQSHHVFLWYNSCGFSMSQRYFAEAEFEFYAVDARKERLLNCEVISCGVALMELKCDIGDQYYPATAAGRGELL
ncbi:hypothetical protein K2173_024284 [Erythroxylum novogranatense]|uniref:TIR domain-containing protein n=1 Tax=Erythroxylum novogranatense TaxID=1862640 RepID=A0AAV8STY7_9ROSI|nr:hypothetical protein K2173_024284 [Erythroxylum novogranatense]